MNAKENHRAHRQVNSCGKRCTTFAKASMALDHHSKPLRLASPKHAARALSCVLWRGQSQWLAVVIERHACLPERGASLPARIHLPVCSVIFLRFHPLSLVRWFLFPAYFNSLDLNLNSQRMDAYIRKEVGILAD